MHYGPPDSRLDRNICMYTHAPRILYVLAGVLAMLWLAGLLTAQTLGGYIHLLLVFSILSVLISLVYEEVRSSSDRVAVR